MSQRQQYQVERDEGEPLGWRPIFGASGSFAFCEGWINAMDSCYPSKPHRIVKPDGNIACETLGHGKPHLNTVDESSDPTGEMTGQYARQGNEPGVGQHSGNPPGGPKIGNVSIWQDRRCVRVMCDTEKEAHAVYKILLSLKGPRDAPVKA